MDQDLKAWEMSLPGPALLNPRFRFDTFVVSPANEAAHAAARAVAEAPSRSHGLLVLSGGIGVGKTHLLHAIGHAIGARHPRLQVLSLDAEQIVHELVDAIRGERLASFRQRWQAFDVLLIDDIQFLSDREGTQEEFFQILDASQANGKRCVLACLSLSRFPQLENRARSLAGNLIVEIPPPDHETGIAILRRKAELAGIHLPEDVLHLIACQERYTIREMEGLVNRVTAYASLTGQPITSDLGHESLREVLSPNA